MSTKNLLWLYVHSLFSQYISIIAEAFYSNSLFIMWICRYLFPGAGIDLSSLAIVEGKICWDLYIEGLVVSSDGNLLDALGAAIKVQCILIYLGLKFI